MKVDIKKLVEKKHLGYRCNTVDMIQFETSVDKSVLTIDDFRSIVQVDLTPHTIEMLYKFFRYLKSDLEGNK